MAHSNCSVTHTLFDIGMHTGAPKVYPNADGTVADNTLWQGGAAAGTYPGAIGGFAATNTSTAEPAGPLRMISVRLETTGTSITFDVNAYDSSLNYVYAVLSAINDTDIDESLLAANTTIAHEAGTVAMVVGGSGDDVLLTLMAA